MSKQSALNALMGDQAPKANPSVITGNMPTKAPPEPGEPTLTQAENLEVKGLESDRFAIFARREQALQKEREALKKERLDFLKDKQEVEKFKTRAKQFDELWGKDKIKALREIGASDEDLINIMAEAQKDGDEPTPEQIARKVATEEAEKIRSEIKNEKLAMEKASQERLIHNLKTDIKDSIKAKAETLEYCAFNGEDSEELAYETIVQNLKLNGQLLSVDEALTIVEEYFESRAKAMDEQIKKRKPVVDPPLSVNEVKATAKTMPSQRPKTLTNAMGATTMAAVSNRRESASEKRERLMNALRVGSL